MDDERPDLEPPVQAVKLNPRHMTLDQWVTYVHNMAKEKGWHDRPRTPLELHALIHSEISEATEAVRDGKPGMYFEPHLVNDFECPKPEGEAVELVDAVIRIMDIFGSRGWSLADVMMEKASFNATRPQRHGGKLY